METRFFCILAALAAAALPSGTSPVRLDDRKSLQRRSNEEEARIFHAHALKKRKKKLLLHCLLGLQRGLPRSEPDPSGRFLVFNYLNLEYNQHSGGGGGGGHGGGGGSNCLGQFTGGSFGGGGSDGDDSDDGDDGDSSQGGIGEGISNLSSLVGQAPATVIGAVSNGVRPVFENSERYFNRYFVRPFYRSVRPFTRLF